MSDYMEGLTPSRYNLRCLLTVCSSIPREICLGPLKSLAGTQIFLEICNNRSAASAVSFQAKQTVQTQQAFVGWRVESGEWLFTWLPRKPSRLEEKVAAAVDKDSRSGPYNSVLLPQPQEEEGVRGCPGITGLRRLRYLQKPAPLCQRAAHLSTGKNRFTIVGKPHTYLHVQRRLKAQLVEVTCRLFGPLV